MHLPRPPHGRLVGRPRTFSRERLRVRAGHPWPLGAEWDGRGTNFSVFAEAAAGVTLCLFDENGTEYRLALPERTHGCWHGYVEGIAPGQRYGYRAEGIWNPEQGLRSNPSKLLIDPYARAIEGEVSWNPAIFPYAPGSDGEVQSHEDSGPFVPRSVVIDAEFDWEDDEPLGRSLADTVIYEMHVKGFSMLNPRVPEDLRGTYAGLAHPASTEYLQRLGITAVELLPVHTFVHENHLVERGLVNYWGYNTIGFFAPHAAYAAARAEPTAVVAEFKRMVKALHLAGIEVLLDVVYNHTAEGGHLGPMLSFKGLDNRAYYRVVPDSPRHYMDFTGVGNTMDTRHPQVVQLVVDSLRYWVEEMHVDGFRFDLAVALARGDSDYDPRAALLTAIQQDPALARTKLIAEPWDVSPGGYQVGHFPPRWAEWNGRYRDTVRDYWRSQPNTLGDLATRFTGSADLYEYCGRTPSSSVNLVTAHDGFTLRDLVSYNEKHNEANLEENRDGTNDNRAWNLGAEGPTDDSAINAVRARQMRNFLATLLLGHGVPMLVAGDELGRTQQGNNNAYCQDNEISWIDWAGADHALLEFTRRLIHLRQSHGTFRRHRWMPARHTKRSLANIAWFATSGQEMSPHLWQDGERRAIGLFLEDLAAGRPRKRRARFDRFYLMLNAGLDEATFRLPSPRWGTTWKPVLDTADDTVGRADVDTAYYARAPIIRPPLSLLVLSCPRG